MATFIRINDFAEAAFTHFDGSEVVVTPRFVMFWRPPGAFGQWTLSPFTIDGVLYNCAEQYMMAEKARLFQDRVIEAQILQCESPRQQKKLGQQVAGFNAARWDAERCHIVFRGNLAKFTQNAELGDELLATGDRRLVEASPMDKIWGIGFAANHPNAYHPDKWTGLNLLGNVLENVRAEMASR
jgi:ribA/ribD-fused uncharacterized protein